MKECTSSGLTTMKKSNGMRKKMPDERQQVEGRGDSPTAVWLMNKGHVPIRQKVEVGNMELGFIANAVWRGIRNQRPTRGKHKGCPQRAREDKWLRRGRRELFC